MERFNGVARHLVPGLLVLCVVSLGGTCFAQDVEVDAPGARGGSGSLVAPSSWVTLIAPVQDRVDLKLYGFYIGDLKVPVAQVDVPIRATRFLTIAPSYMYYAVPPSGLNDITNRPDGYADTYAEHQFRIDGTVTFPIRKFEISARNMYVRRFRPTPVDDSNRYRGRIAIAHPLAVNGRVWKPFASYEGYYERAGGWNRDRVWSGVTVPLKKHVLFQPSYMWERSEGSKDVHYVLFGLIVSTR